MASIYGDDPFGNGTMVDGRRRRTTAVNPFDSGGSTQTSPLPGGMPGTQGNPNTGFNPNPGGTAPTPPPSAVPTTRVTSLMEGDTGKLADPSHIAGSPKYQFLSLAPFYGRGQENDLLKQLQSSYGDYWNGWNFDGRGNFNYGGDPSRLNSAWNGVTSVDAYGGYNDGSGALRARWGADDGSSDPFTSAASAPRDPMASLPSWLTDGINAQDLVRLGYNTYLGRDPGQSEIAGQTGNGSFSAFDPRILNSLEQIAKSAEAQQYASNHQGYAPPPVPGMGAFGNSAAVGQALQRLSQALPQMLSGGGGPAAPPDALSEWLYKLFGLGVG